ncbi:hypothetical protein [Paracoccus sanguinis]|uniref:hypothetical protein n=1 Tax=Paracoccus sanguinis TaxID=1545044 RepID=UPI00145243E6|nr:hypothetical protein [Paracoccus sanguinis]QJD15511.1 hypothetical protein HGN31_00305 [Paracoccus sanguinis]
MHGVTVNGVDLPIRADGPADVGHRARFDRIAKGAHILCIEAPEAPSRILTRFLRETSP